MTAENLGAVTVCCGSGGTSRKCIIKGISSLEPVLPNSARVLLMTKLFPVFANLFKYRSCSLENGDGIIVDTLLPISSVLLRLRQKTRGSFDMASWPVIHTIYLRKKVASCCIDF